MQLFYNKIRGTIEKKSGIDVDEKFVFRPSTLKTATEEEKMFLDLANANLKDMRTLANPLKSSEDQDRARTQIRDRQIRFEGVMNKLFDQRVSYFLQGPTDKSEEGSLDEVSKAINQLSLISCGGSSNTSAEVYQGYRKNTPPSGSGSVYSTPRHSSAGEAK
jgi:hypothetical protein